MFKFLGKSALLAAAVCVLLIVASPFLTPKWIDGNVDNGHSYITTTTAGFLNSGERELDVLFVGSSQVLRGIAPSQLLEETGLSGWTRATPVQAPSVSYYYLEDALKRKDVKLVVAEFSALYTEYDPDYREPYLRYAFDWMPLSFDKVKAVKNALETSESQSIIDYIFPALYYHDRLITLSSLDITWPVSGDRTDENRGALPIDESAPQDYCPLLGDGTEAAEYNESALYWYQKMIDLCKAKGVPMLIFRSPRGDWTEERHTADLALAEKNGLELLDINLKNNYDEIGLDSRTDFIDFNHLCSSGAKKLTSWLGDKLLEMELWNQ